MENNQEQVLVTSTFDSAGCHKFALILYMCLFIYGIIMGSSIGMVVGMGLLMGLILAAVPGGLMHCILYFTAKNNKIILTECSITGIYNRHLSLNIPIDSVSSISKGWRGSLCITCAGSKYNISFVSNRDEFCLKLNELLGRRTQQALKSSYPTPNQPSSLDEIEKLKHLLDNGAITQEEFETKKKQILNL